MTRARDISNVITNADLAGDIDVDGTANLDVVDIDGAVDMASTLTLAGNADFNGDLDVDGTSNLDAVDIDLTLNVAGETTLQSHLNMGDNDKIKLGASGDLEIFHDGSKSVISDEGTGVLWIAGDSEVSIGNPAVTEYYIRAFKDGAVQLMHDNSTKFATSSGGVTVTGDIANTSGDLTLDVAGDIILNADGGDIKLSDGSTTFGELTNNPNADGNFDIRCPVSDADIRIKGVDGGSNVQAVLFDMSDAGTAVFNHNVRLAVDDSFLSVGASDDFIMFHDGTDSHLLNSTGDLIINSAASDEDIIFKVNDGGSSTETARFDASFDAFVLRDGGGAAVSAGKLEINASGSSYNLIALKTTRTATGTNFIEFFNSSGTNAGEINHNGSTTVNYSTSSDYRLKENVTYDFDATSRLKQLKPARFNFIADPDVTMDGFLAHEVKDIVPIAVNGDKDEIKKWNKEEIERGFAPDGASEGDNKLDDDGNPIPKYQGIDNSHLVPLLTKALQEALTRIDTLEAEVKTLKGE